MWCSQDHKAINYLVQGTEALAQKLAEIRMTSVVEKRGLSDKVGRILSVHDECLWDCEEGVEHEMGSIIAGAYTWAGEMLFKYYRSHPEKFPNEGTPTFKIDLSGGYDIGDNYGEVH